MDLTLISIFGCGGGWFLGKWIVDASICPHDAHARPVWVGGVGVGGM